MGSPIILPFKPTDGGNSLTSMNSIIIGVGIVWGSASVPLTPLVFSKENISKSLGSGSSWLNKLPVNNKDFYENQYSSLPLGEQEKYYGTTKNWTKSDVGGFAIGFAPGGIIKEVARNAGKLAVKYVLKKVVHKLATTVSLDSLQSSQSLQATLYGMNGRDTYNLEMAEMSASKNIFIVQASAGVIVGMGLNLMFIGDFEPLFKPGQSIDDAVGNLPAYIWKVFQKAKAFAVIGDGAIGAILPNVQLSIIAS